MLSAEQVKIIEKYPIDDILSTFSEKAQGFDDKDEAWRKRIIGDLLAALICSHAAGHLKLNSGGLAARQLLGIRMGVLEGPHQSHHFETLLRAVTTRAPIAEVWAETLNLINLLRPSTPPRRSIVPTELGTPIKTNSSHLRDDELGSAVKRELFYELRDCTHRAVPGFWDKRFDMARWSEAQKAMLAAVLTGHNGTVWVDFPADPWEKGVWDWLVKLEKMALVNASYKLHANITATEFKQQRKGQMDMFFQRVQPPERACYNYKDVLVVGEHKRAYDTGDFKACFLQLARHVRSVFADQPLRCFVHAFTIRATMMESWIFDRSGAYSSGSFNIHDHPDKFARALVAYATMDDTAMGFNKSIKSNGGHHHVIVQDNSEQDESIPLDRLFIRQRAVVCRATTCFWTNQGVAKFSWRSAKRQPYEVRHLQLALERGVEGVATIKGHCRITSVAELRSGLELSQRTRHRFRPDGFDSLEGFNRRSSSHAPPSKRRRLRSTRSSTRSSSAESSGERREQEDAFDDRILSCIVIAPYGRTLSDFGSVKELLEALRDAIRAHQSLYSKGRILHRDISPNNIIIPPESSHTFRGMLIDLDLAKERDAAPSGAPHKTGTREFMAIGVLRGHDHTYRHDLESFLYVLLWMCARCAWDTDKVWLRKLSSEGRPEESALRFWESGRFRDIAGIKEDQMTGNGVRRITDEFPAALEEVKPLCFSLRNILFPIGEDGDRIIVTPEGPEENLYQAIISAYDETIRKL